MAALGLGPRRFGLVVFPLTRPTMGETKTKYKSKMHKKNNYFQSAQSVPNSIVTVPN
jgi:hypothetical protein